MKSKLPGLIAGLCLITVGALVMLHNYYIIDLRAEYVIAAIFFVVGICFFFKYLVDRDQLWAMILGTILIFVSFAIYVGNTYWIDDAYIGVAVLYLAGMAFLIGYLNKPNVWGVLIPAGGCFSVGTLVLYEETRLLPYFVETPTILFIGMFLTFGLLFIMRTETRKTGWAIFPALGCLFVAAIIEFSHYAYFFQDFVFPTILIVVGGFIVFKSMLNKKRNEDTEITVHE